MGIIAEEAPLGVKIIGGIHVLAGLIFILAAVATLTRFPIGVFPGGVAAAVGLTAVGAIFNFVLAVVLLGLRIWAWWLFILLSVLGLATSVLQADVVGGAVTVVMGAYVFSKQDIFIY